MKKQTIIISIITVIFIGLIGGGFWIFENKKQETEESVGTSEDLKKFNISHWKTYRSENYGFEIKYPDNWEFDEFDGVTFSDKLPKDVRRLGANEMSKKLAENTEGDILINISKYSGIRKNYSTLIDWRKHDVDNAINNKENHYYKKFSFSKDESLVFERRYYNEKIGVTSYYFFNNDDGYEITVYYSKNSNGLAEKIITTLDLYK